MTKAVEPRLLTAKDAAAYLSLPVAAVRRMLDGRVMIGGRTRWDRQALDALLDGRYVNEGRDSFEGATRGRELARLVLSVGASE